MGERGAVSVVMAALLGFAVVLALGLAEVSAVAGARARARSAADAAALAAAQELVAPSTITPEAAASEYARRNGARLERCHCPPGGGEAVVTVAIEVAMRWLAGTRVVRASARAVTDAPAGTNGLQPWFAARLGCLFDRVPGLSVVSGFRTREEQARLHRSRPHLAAPPGTSQHEVGLAADLGFPDARARTRAHDEAGTCGLRFPISYEPWHVEPARS